MFRTRSAVALTAVLVAAAGCGAAQDQREPVGEHVIAYAENVHGTEWVGEVDLPSALVMQSAADIEDWVETLPDPEPTLFEPLFDVDLDEHFLVLGGYPRCTETSSIVLVGTGDDASLVFEVTAPESDTMCAWSPYTLDAWAVPRSATDGEVPGSVPISHAGDTGTA